MGDGQSGNGVAVVLPVDQGPNQVVEHVPHQNHPGAEHLAKEKIHKLRHVLWMTVQQNQVTRNEKNS